MSFGEGQFALNWMELNFFAIAQHKERCWAETIRVK